MFQYSAVPLPQGGGFDSRGLTRPAFGYPSKESRDGEEFEGRKIPGLGNDSVPESFSVWSVDVSNDLAPRISSRWKTGLLIHSPADNATRSAGAPLISWTVQNDALYVSNGNNDMIDRLDLRQGQIAARGRIIPSPLVARLRGVGPSGLAVSPDGRRLYVAESRINAIGVLDAIIRKPQGNMYADSLTIPNHSWMHTTSRSPLTNKHPNRSLWVRYRLSLLLPSTSVTSYGSRLKRISRLLAGSSKTLSGRVDGRSIPGRGPRRLRQPGRQFRRRV